MNVIESLNPQSQMLRFSHDEDLKDLIMNEEKQNVTTAKIDGILFRINTITVEINPNYKYSLSSAMITLEEGNGLFVRQVIPTYIINNQTVWSSEQNKYSWEYMGSGLKRIKSGKGNSIEACYRNFQFLAQTLVAV